MRICRCVGVLCGLAAGVGIAIGVAALNGGQALAQPDSQPAAATGLKIATVDVLRIVERYLAKPELDSARSALVKSWQDQLNTADAELKGMQDQARTLPQNDPRLQELGQQYQTKVTAFQQLQQDAQGAVNKLSSQQMVQGFDAVRAIIKTITVRNGYTLVLMSRPAGEPIDPSDQNLVLQQILARPVLEAAGATDITEAIIAEMKLPPPPAATPPQAPPAPAGSNK